MQNHTLKTTELILKNGVRCTTVKKFIRDTFLKRQKPNKSFALVLDLLNRYKIYKYYNIYGTLP